jgi:hypothetical protein
MIPRSIRIVVLLLLLTAARSPAADAPLATTHGRIVKANAKLVILRPPTQGGRLGDAIVLKLTGTSRVTVVTIQQRGGQPAAVQRDVEAKDLQPNQIIAAIYTVIDQDKVLLSAAVQPAAGR